MKTLPLAVLASLLLASAPAVAQSLAQLKLPAQKPAPEKPAARPAAKPAPEKPAAEDALGNYIEEQFKTFGGWNLCASATVAEIRAEVVRELKRRNLGETAANVDVATALATRFPCPFSPERDELRAATAKEIEGVWLSPEGSQELRFGPKSPSRPGGPGVAVRCEIVGYFPDGELRTGLVRGTDACPFGKAADIAPARARPKVATWSLLRDGRLAVARADVAGHIEEWDIYVVRAPFSAGTVEFKVGDLVSYLRREKGNDINAATEFRHLQRLQ